MVQLTEKELGWLRVNYPELTYNEELNVISGTLSFSLCYKGCVTISDSYVIDILLNEQDYSLLPVVKETGGKIVRYAKIANVPQDQLHQYPDGRICMVRPDKVEVWYPEGFDFEIFMRHIETHFYWVSHTAIYGEEPWEGEAHGGNYINNSIKWKKE